MAGRDKFRPSVHWEGLRVWKLRGSFRPQAKQKNQAPVGEPGFGYSVF